MTSDGPRLNGRLLTAAAILAAAPMAGCMAEARGDGIARARDGNIAIQEELEAARKTGTVAAYDLFLARHPGHPLVETATRERARLREVGAARK